MKREFYDLDIDDGLEAFDSQVKFQDEDLSESEDDENDPFNMFNSKETIFDKFLRWIVISPENMFFHFWKVFVLLVSITSSIVYANFAAFRSDVDYSGYMEYSS